MMTYLQAALNKLYPVLNHSPWRFIAALTEEAGEVQGAFNKMVDGNTRKPKTSEDVAEELIQLTACCFIAGAGYDMSPDVMIDRVRDFMEAKYQELVGPRCPEVDNIPAGWRFRFKNKQTGQLLETVDTALAKQLYGDDIWTDVMDNWKEVDTPVPPAYPRKPSHQEEIRNGGSYTADHSSCNMNIGCICPCKGCSEVSHYTEWAARTTPPRLGAANLDWYSLDHTDLGSEWDGK